MLQEKEQREAQSNLIDSDSVYGWISILLHWITAIVIVVLWFVGKGIMTAELDSIDAQRQLHVSIAASAWLIIMIRVVWRIRSGHPHIKGQTLTIHRIAKVAHYIMLLAVVLMLISGPLMIWSGGNSINIFDWVAIPGPFGESESIREMSWFIHSNSAFLLLLLVLLHIGGALKHLMFHADDTIARMIWPGRRANK